MALVGYAPVSSMEQSLEVQRDKLKHCHKVFEEQKSGTSDQRPRLDRLARSTLHLCQMADKLQD